MHLFEYALRDFINVERFADWSSVIVFDDMLPRNVDEAARDRHTKMWTGDVYKVVPVLQKYRPDLTVIQVDTEPTGVAVVFGADATSTALSDAYEEIVGEWVVPDPQKVRSGSRNGCTRSSRRNCSARRSGVVWSARVTAGYGARVVTAGCAANSPPSPDDQPRRA